MNQTPSQTHPLLGAARRARTLRLFLMVLVGTLWLLLIEPARQVVSLAATITAIGLGVGFAIEVTVGLTDVDLQHVNDVTEVVVTLGCICVATIVVWLIVPRQYLRTMLQFVLAFMWTMPVTQLLNQYYRTHAPS